MHPNFALKILLFASSALSAAIAARSPNPSSPSHALIQRQEPASFALAMASWASNIAAHETPALQPGKDSTDASPPSEPLWEIYPDDGSNRNGRRDIRRTITVEHFAKVTAKPITALKQLHPRQERRARRAADSVPPQDQVSHPSDTGGVSAQDQGPVDAVPGGETGEIMADYESYLEHHPQ